MQFDSDVRGVCSALALVEHLLTRIDTDGDTVGAGDLSDSNEFSARTAPDVADDIPREHGEVRRRCGADSLDRRQRFPEVHRRNKMFTDLLVPTGLSKHRTLEPLEWFERSKSR